MARIVFGSKEAKKIRARDERLEKLNGDDSRTDKMLREDLLRWQNTVEVTQKSIDNLNYQLDEAKNQVELLTDELLERTLKSDRRVFEEK